MKWFGTSWKSELCTKARMAAHPSKACAYCKKQIGKSDRGVIAESEAWHLHCFLALVVGQV